LIKNHDNLDVMRRRSGGKMQTQERYAIYEAAAKVCKKLVKECRSKRKPGSAALQKAIKLIRKLKHDVDAP
jgi:hypothetical protein